MIAQNQPLARLVRLETPRYIVRTLGTEDATETWGDWLADPTAARNLNALPKRLSAAEVRAYIEKFDRINSDLLGIIEKETGTLIGIRANYIDWKQREFLINVLVGETEARNKGARSETRTAMYRYYFEDLDLLAARCSVVATNTAMLNVTKRNGWVHERTSRKSAADGNGAVELLHFRLPRGVWRQKEIERTS
jgi:RimJ/RimL family protein N-acetyltransferase